MASTKHSVVGASGAYRWGACPGSVALCAGLGDNPTSEFAAEGTVAHMVLEQSVDAAIGWGELIAQEFLSEIYDIEGQAVVVDADMVEHVNDLLRWFISLPDLQHVHAELAVTLGDDYDPRAFGTADLVAITEGEDLYVTDLKYGAGLEVKAKGNPQTRYYALGVAHTLDQDFDRVHLTIAQPRTSGPPRETETLTFAELQVWGRGWLKPALARVREAEDEWADSFHADAALDGWGERYLQAGNHCRFCPAKLHCPEFQNHVAPGLDIRRAKAMTDEQIGLIIERKSMIRKFLAEVEREAFDRRMKGIDLGGPKLVHGKRYRVWKNEKKAAVALSAVLGSKAYTQSLITPPALEKLKPEGYKKILADHSFAQPGALTLVDSGDSRSEVTRRTAGEAFAHLTK